MAELLIWLVAALGAVGGVAAIAVAQHLFAQRLDPFTEVAPGHDLRGVTHYWPPDVSLPRATRRVRRA